MAPKSRMRTNHRTARHVGFAMNLAVVINDVIAMTAANVRMSVANVRGEMVNLKIKAALTVGSRIRKKGQGPLAG